MSPTLQFDSVPSPRGRWRVKTEDSTFVVDFDTNKVVFDGGPAFRFVHALVKVGKPMQLLTFRDDVEAQPSKIVVTSPVQWIEAA